MGLTYGPLGTALTELFPTAVRYTGASIAFNIAGILGGSLAPYIATWLAKNYGIAAVGYYLSVAAAITLAALVALQSRERARSNAADSRDVARHALTRTTAPISSRASRRRSSSLRPCRP